jgi:membrane fusion protein (multidrug efflux system)
VSACSQQKKDEIQSLKPEKVVPVTTEQVVLSDLTETFTLPANLEAWEDLTLAAELAGAIYKINVKEGDKVKVGQVLLEIDPDTTRSLLLKNQNDVILIEQKFHRYQQLVADGLVSQQELDDLKNRLVAAESALKTTKLQLAKSFPQAPVSGIIDRLYVDRGEYVDPGKPLLQLVQTEKLKVIADVPEKDVQFLHLGDQVEIVAASINATSSDPISGVIDHIALSANPATRTYRTKIIIDNSSAKLRPGMIVRAQFVRQKLQQVISIPLFAVIDRDGEKYVFINSNGQAKKTNVVIGSSIGQRIVIEEGLKQNQELIIAGQQLLVDGSKIAVGDK